MQHGTNLFTKVCEEIGAKIEHEDPLFLAAEIASEYSEKAGLEALDTYLMTIEKTNPLLDRPHQANAERNCSPN